MTQIVIDYGLMPFCEDGVWDGYITIGQKHAGQKLSDDEVDRHYIAWLYAVLENTKAPEEVFTAMYHWGCEKTDSDALFDDPDYPTFDELLNLEKLKFVDLRDSKSAIRALPFNFHRLNKGRRAFHQNPETGRWGTIPISESRKIQRERLGLDGDAGAD